MKNQTPHTPPTQTPSPANKKGIIAMKPPIFPQEMLEKFEQLMATPFSKETIEASNKALIQAELKKQQNQIPDYTEVAWLKVLTQDLDKPQCPEVKILKKWQLHQECCCWELEDETGKYYQYDWYWAIEEAGFRKIEVLSNENWRKLKEELWVKWLRKLLWLKEPKDYKGYCSRGKRFNHEYEVNYWSDSVYTPSPTNSKSLCMYSSKFSVSISFSNQFIGFSVRCRLKD